MDTRTLIQAVGEIKSNNYKIRFRDLQGIYSVYGEPFERITALKNFQVPVNLIWGLEEKVDFKDDREVVTRVHYFRLDEIDYYPDTIADFVSIINSLRKFKLTPRFVENEPTAAVLWNRDRNQ
jgi:hypothetical protein|tara:strand:- start:849 stop:1217 length:369 start_codon:yes stop_codon:yes gene_type:complete